MELVDEIKSVIANSLKIPPEQLTDSSKLEEFGVSSFDILQLGFDIEEKFNIELPLKAGKDGPAFNNGYDNLSENMMSMSVDDIARIIKQIIDAKVA